MKIGKRVPLNIVELGNLKKKGDAAIVENKGKKQLVICCPGCGLVGSSNGDHVYTPETESYYPSINHSIGDGCGWHGWLENGEFRDA